MPKRQVETHATMSIQSSSCTSRVEWWIKAVVVVVLDTATALDLFVSALKFRVLICGFRQDRQLPETQQRLKDGKKEEEKETDKREKGR